MSIQFRDKRLLRHLEVGDVILHREEGALKKFVLVGTIPSNGHTVYLFQLLDDNDTLTGPPRTNLGHLANVPLEYYGHCRIQSRAVWHHG